LLIVECNFTSRPFTEKQRSILLVLIILDNHKGRYYSSFLLWDQWKIILTDIQKPYERLTLQILKSTQCQKPYERLTAKKNSVWKTLWAAYLTDSKKNSVSKTLCAAYLLDSKKNSVSKTLWAAICIL